MVKQFSPFFSGLLALGVVLGVQETSALSQPASGSAFQAQAQAALDGRCTQPGAPLAACQQLAVELKRNQALADPVVAMDEDGQAPREAQPRLTAGEQRAAQALRCVLVPATGGCVQD